MGELEDRSDYVPDDAKLLREKAGSRRGTRADMIVRYLVEMIVRGELEPGDHIVEAAIASRLGTSKTPVREAIKMLPTTGLAVSYPYRGTFVRELTTDFVDEVVSVRTRLETFAGELAIRFVSDHDIDGLCALARKMEAAVQAGEHFEALTIDVEYHTRIYRWARHTLLLEMWETLLPRVEFLQAYSRLFASPLPKGHVEQRHLELALAFGTRDRAGVAEALTKHIELGPELLRRSGRYGPFRPKEPA